MAHSVEMPELGESVTEGTVTQWLKKVGDKVEVDEPLLEVSTDKVDTEIPSPVSGTLLKILAEEDDTVEVGDPIAEIGEEGEEPSDGDSDSADAADSAAEEEPAAEEDKAAEADKADTDSPDTAEETESSSSKSSSSSGSSGSGTAEDVTMPELGESVTEGTITQWLKQVGDTVEVDEPLLEVSTDKVDTEIPSPVAGTLVEILANEDDTVEVGDVIARVGDADAAPSSSSADSDSDSDENTAAEKSQQQEAADDTADTTDDTEQDNASGSAEDSASADATAGDDSSATNADDASAAADEAPENQSAQAESQRSSGSSAGEPAAGNLPYVTPLVRKLAEKHNIDLSTITGSGVGGRIRKQDILAAAEGGKSSDTTGSGGSGQQNPAGPRASLLKVDPAKQKLRGTTQKVNRVREITARTTVASLQNSAQLTQLHEVDLTRVSDLRQAVKQEFEKKHGAKLTFLPFIAKAVVEALINHPNINASYDAQRKEMTYHDQVNLGIAVDTPEGLLSPVIRDAQKLSLVELAQAIGDLAHRARNKELKPQEVTGGTFTITNIGSEGALADTPILVPPQAAMVGTGAVIKRPVVLLEEDNEAIAIRDMAFLPLTYDHQVIDGADAGRFMTTVRDRLETADFLEDLEL